MADDSDLKEERRLGFLARDDEPTTPDEPVSEEVATAELQADLIELGRKATDGEFDPNDRSTWPDVTPETQLQAAVKRYDRHPDFAAQTKRWGRAMRKQGANPAAHEAVLDDAKKRAARLVQAELPGELKKELMPGATPSDRRKFSERFKASVVNDTYQEFQPRLDEEIVNFGQFEAAIWEEHNPALRGNLSLREYVDTRVQEFVAAPPSTPAEVIAAAVAAPATVEDSGAGKPKRRHRNRLRDEFDQNVREMRDMGYSQEKMCKELTRVGVKPSDISEKAKWRMAPTFREAWKNPVFKPGVKTLLSKAVRSR
jgi:hypothetical protein